MTAAERMRRYRARKKPPPPVFPDPPSDPVAALADWSRETLVVPPGHPAAGQPMELPPFAVEFLRDGWAAHESALSVARKNAKSAVIAVLILGFLAGPLRRPGWRGCVCSVSKEKAAELRRQVVEIAEASGLEGLRVRRSPYPGSIEGAGGQTFETLSADRSAGHASGFDLVLFDETGLTQERDRELLAGLRSSISARAGRVIHLSVRGASPLYREILENPATVAHVYAAPDDCALDDRGAWAAANPGLGTIKQLSYMENEVERLKAVPSDENTFRAFDLNQKLDPSQTMICKPDDLRACFGEPDFSGRVVVGFDFGGATSGTAACAIWPQTGALRTWFAFGSIPSLRERGRRDDADYLQMEKRGELKVYPDCRVTPVSAFLADVAADLAGFRVVECAADGYKDSEALDYLERARLRWPVTFRRVGAGKDGGKDVRSFQNLIEGRKLTMKENLSLADAVLKSTIRRDGNDNPGLDKSTKAGRIDVLSAAVIAAGLAASRMGKPPPRRFRYAVAG